MRCLSVPGLPALTAAHSLRGKPERTSARRPLRAEDTRPLAIPGVGVEALLKPTCRERKQACPRPTFHALSPFPASCPTSCRIASLPVTLRRGDGRRIPLFFPRSRVIDRSIWGCANKSSRPDWAESLRFLRFRSAVLQRLLPLKPSPAAVTFASSVIAWPSGFQSPSSSYRKVFATHR